MKDIIKFKNEKELKKVGDTLKKLLFLDDWYINYKLIDKTETRVLGKTEASSLTREAIIEIYNGKEEPLVLKSSKLLTLIHELLHLKDEYIILISKENDLSTNESIYIHSNLEKMAKSLYMALIGRSLQYIK